MSVAGLTALFVLQAILLLGSSMDDPYIFARYARNLWRFGDLVWNPGEPRIEGISSWLWFLVYLVGVRIMPDPVLLAKFVGIGTGVVLTASLASQIRKDLHAPWAATVALGVFVFSPALAFYAACGMDHVAWSLIVWLYLVWMSGSETIGPRHMVVAALGLLVRPEGFLLFVPALALGVAKAVRSESPVQLRVSFVAAVGWGFAVLAALFATRLMLFGEWLPNAAAAKHSGGSVLLRVVDGALYLGHGVGLYLVVPTVALSMAAGVGSHTLVETDRERRLIIAAVFFVLGLLGFILAAGGDDTSAFGETRLITPAIAPATYVLFCSLRSLDAKRCGWLGALAVLFITLTARVPSAAGVLRLATGATNLTSPQDIVLAWRRVFRSPSRSPLSEYLRRNTPSGQYIAVPWVGLVPWETDLPTIDLLGLSDAHIAKARVVGRGGPDSRYDPDYVLDRRPYFICENFVLQEPLDRIRNLDDAGLRAIGAFKVGQRRLLRHPRLFEQYEVDRAAPVAGVCFRRRSVG
jgi:arabinofuranosyltransferase